MREPHGTRTTKGLPATHGTASRSAYGPPGGAQQRLGLLDTPFGPGRHRDHHATRRHFQPDLQWEGPARPARWYRVEAKAERSQRSQGYETHHVSNL